jgi:hemerythrin-like metal-binding protein
MHGPAADGGGEEMARQMALLVRFIDLFRTTACGNLVDKDGIDAAARVLDQLRQHAATHFACQERLLAARHDSDLEAHQAQHRDLSLGMKKLQQEICARGAGGTPLKLSFFVTTWLLEHIMGEQLGYFGFVPEMPLQMGGGA